MKCIVFLLLLLPFLAQAQSAEDAYLKTHHYPFSLDSGFDVKTSAVLREKLSPYNVILQGEGGSHFLELYKMLPFVWLRFLQQEFGLTQFFLEGGHTSDLLLNRYLQTGDSSYIFVKDNRFWKALYAYNTKLLPSQRLHYFGIDFESPKTYVKALKALLPATVPPQQIATGISLIRNANDSAQDCSSILQLNKILQKALDNNKKAFMQFLGDTYPD